MKKYILITPHKWHRAILCGGSLLIIRGFSDPAGDYYFILDIDYTREIPESDDTDNVLGAMFTLDPADVDLTIPDLTPTQSGMEVSSVRLGEGLELEGTVLNQGATPSISSDIAIYLSDDETISPDDWFLGYYFIGPVEGGEEYPFQANLQIPEHIDSGAYFVVAQIDANNINPETDETNNIASVALQIEEADDGTPPPEPQDIDLVITEVLMSDDEVKPDDVVEFLAEIFNDGTERAIFPFVSVNLSTSPDENGTISFLYQGIISAIDGQELEEMSGFFTVPDWVDPGSYYVVFKVDNFDIIDETDEDNNVFAVPIEILPPVTDLLLVEAQIQTTDLSAGQEVGFHVLAANDEIDAAPSSYTGIFLSFDDMLDPSDIGLGNIYTQGIGPGDVLEVQGSVQVPSDFGFGDFYLIFELDNFHEIDETDETNNIESIEVNISPATLDAALVDGSLNKSVARQGDFIDFIGTVVNSGPDRFSILQRRVLPVPGQCIKH